MLSTGVIIAIVLSSTILLAILGLTLTILGLTAKRKQPTLKVSLNEPVQNGLKADLEYVNIIVIMLANTDNLSLIHI